MKNKLDNFSGLILIQFFHALAENVNYIFITLYFWRQFSITGVIQFRLYELLLIPLVILIVGFLLDRVSAKLTFFIGLLLFFLQLILIIFLGERAGDYLLPLAFFSGVSTVFRFLSLNVINQNSILLKDQIIYFSKLNIHGKIISILFPIVSSFLVLSLGYNFIFALALIFIILIGLLLLFIPINTIKNVYRPFDIYKNWNKEKTVLFGVNFFWGIEYALFATLIPIVTTIMFKSELGWGIVTSVLGIISVVFSLFFQKSSLLNKSIVSLVIIGFLITISSLVFVSNSNILTFLFFMVFVQLWQSIQMIGLKPLINKIISNEPNASILTTEFSVFMEIPFMIGRLLLLLLLFFIGSDLENITVVGFLFAALGFIPFYESKFIFGSKQAIEKAL